jgi:hypothetical protein
MPKPIRRGAAAVSPMPARLDCAALLRIGDQSGRIVRQETLEPFTDLRERLRVAHENYERQGWTVNDLRPGQWAFVAELGNRRLMIAIRPLKPEVAAACEAHVPVAQSPAD